MMIVTTKYIYIHRRCACIKHTAIGHITLSPVHDIHLVIFLILMWQSKFLKAALCLSSSSHTQSAHSPREIEMCVSCINEIVSRFPECGCLKDNYFLIREHNFANNESRLAGVRPLLFANYYGTFKKIWKLKKKIASVSIGNKTHAIHSQHNKPYTEHNSEAQIKSQTPSRKHKNWWKMIPADCCTSAMFEHQNSPRITRETRSNQRRKWKSERNLNFLSNKCLKKNRSGSVHKVNANEQGCGSWFSLTVSLSNAGHATV